MYVQQNTTINGEVVDQIAEFAGLTVYESRGGDLNSILYFAKKNKVVQVLTIKAGMGQGMGYVDQLLFHAPSGEQ